jgi:hypothetical protein
MTSKNIDLSFWDTLYNLIILLLLITDIDSVPMPDTDKVYRGREDEVRSLIFTELWGWQKSRSGRYNGNMCLGARGRWHTDNSRPFKMETKSLQA